MAKITIKLEISNSSTSGYLNSYVKPYQTKIDEIEKKIPGSLQLISEISTPLTYNLYTMYELVYENPWFVKDMTLEVTYDNQYIDDGSGSKFHLEMLSGIKFRLDTSNSPNGALGLYNYGWSNSAPNNGSFRSGICNHVAVNVGFHLKNMRCKFCDKDMN